MALVTQEEALAHLRLDLPTGEADILIDLEAKMEQASDIVLEYLKVDEDVYSGETVPSNVTAATLLVLGDLWENRIASADSNPLSDTVKSLLHRMRDPAMA